MQTKYHMAALAALVFTSSLTADAQGLKLKADAMKSPYIMTSVDTVKVECNAGFNTVAVSTNTDGYTVTPTTADADWVTCRKEQNGNLSFFTSYYYGNLNPRYASFKLTTPDGSYSRTLVVCQKKNNAAERLGGDTQLTIGSASASNSQSGEGIERTYDGNTATLWHSSYSGGGFPITLTYRLKQASHVDYLVYTPRTSGGENGLFGEVEVSYALASSPSKFVSLGTQDFGFSTGASTVSFGDEGVDNVSTVRIVVKSGKNNFASCAEMGFFTKDRSLNDAMSELFTSNLCSELKDGVTDEAIAKVHNPYLRQLAMTIHAGDYSTKFRVGSFGAYETTATQASRLKTNGYNPYENPTGIYFDEGDKIVVFAEGIDSRYPVNLVIKSFSNESKIESEGQPESRYTLANGANVITASNRGNGYVAYYTDNYADAPQVKLHFAMAKENGYFDLGRGDTNEDWEKLLANAKGDIIDVVTPRMQVAVPLASAKSVCPKDGVKLATIYDETIRREREVMGMPQIDPEPKNHQFARPVKSGMYADGTGAAAAFGSFNEWTNPNSFGFWGFGHELGHVNQVRPDFKWVGCGETTNNIYAAWVEHKLGAKDAYGTGYHRLEDERSGIDDYSNVRGGRFETYLEEGVRKGVCWQLQDGPDYHGSQPTQVTVQGQDADGKNIGAVTTTWRNYDHFVKVVPLWQLMLYTQEAGQSVDAYGKMISEMRKANDAGLTNGQRQIKMMQRFCDVTGINFLPFFEKAGMLKPINALIEDYSREWLVISQDQVDQLKAYIAAKNYPEAPAALNYINAYNWQTFRDKGTIPTDIELNKGCSASGNRVRVDNTVWQNAVGYETYDEKGDLMRISMFGLGDTQMSSRYTYVLFPTTAKYIMAVGYDGQRVKCYEKQ